MRSSSSFNLLYDTDKHAFFFRLLTLFSSPMLSSTAFFFNDKDEDVLFLFSASQTVQPIRVVHVASRYIPVKLVFFTSFLYFLFFFSWFLLFNPGMVLVVVEGVERTRKKVPASFLA